MSSSNSQIGMDGSPSWLSPNTGCRVQCTLGTNTRAGKGENLACQGQHVYIWNGTNCLIHHKTPPLHEHGPPFCLLVRVCTGAVEVFSNPATHLIYCKATCVHGPLRRASTGLLHAKCFLAFPLAQRIGPKEPVSGVSPTLGQCGPTLCTLTCVNRSDEAPLQWSKPFAPLQNGFAATLNVCTSMGHPFACSLKHAQE